MGITVFSDKDLPLETVETVDPLLKALAASGPLLADLQAGTAFAVATGAKGNHDGGSPFPEMVTRAWAKELKHRRRMFEG